MELPQSNSMPIEPLPTEIGVEKTGSKESIVEQFNLEHPESPIDRLGQIITIRIKLLSSQG